MPAALKTLGFLILAGVLSSLAKDYLVNNSRTVRNLVG